MRKRNLIALVAAVASLSAAVADSGARKESPAPMLGAQVRAILLTKCGECHGRALRRPKGSLYLDDMQKLAADRDLVVPYQAEKSYLWKLIRAGDMPAKGAKAGPLTAAEKEAFRAWIAGGAEADSRKSNAR